MLATISQNCVKIGHKAKNKNVNPVSLKNLEDNKTKKFSAKAIARVKNVLNNLIDAETIGRFGLNWKKHKKNVNLAFVTLTLPYTQEHKDISMKKMLNYFITELSAEVGKFKYVWKAERQQNKNIHFHILINKKIYHATIRQIWNNILARQGYIQKYKEKFSKMTMQEYINYRKNNAKIKHTKEHIEKYKKAYLKGCKEGWTNPNTTDIHSLYSIGSISAYIAKYMQKDSGEIEGRYWGCSDELRNYIFKTQVTRQDITELRKYSSKFIEEQYYSIYYLTNIEVLKLLSFFLNFLLYLQTLYCLLNGMQYSVTYMKKHEKT